MLLAQYAGQVRDGGPTISNVFRIHQVSEFPAPFQSYVALELEIDNHEVGQHELLLRIIDEDGSSLCEVGLTAEFRRRPTMGPIYAYATPVVSASVLRPGLHRLDLIHNGEIISERVFEVIGPDG